MAKKLTYKDLEGNVIYIDKVDALTPPVHEVTLYQELGDDENGTISQKALTDIINNITFEEEFTQEVADELYQPIGDYVEPETLVTVLEDFLSKEEAEENYQPLGDYLTEVPEEYATKDYVDEAVEGIDLSGYATKEELNNYQPVGDYLTEIPVDYVRKEDLIPYARIENLPKKVSDLTNDKGYTDVEDVEAIVDEKLGNNETLASKFESLQESFKELSDDFNTVEGSIANKANVGDSYTKAESDARYLQTVPEEYAKKSDLPTVPKKVSDLEQDIDYLTEIPSEYALKSDIPTVPTKVSELQNDAEYITENDLEGYAKTSDIPTVPTKVSELENDLQYLREHQSLDNYYTKIEANTLHAEMERGFANTYTKDEIDADFLHKSEALSNEDFYNKSQSDARFQPIGNYLTEHQSLEGYATEQWVEEKNYLTQHQSLENYFTKDEATVLFQPVGDYLTEHQSLENYYTKSEADERYLQEHQSLDAYLRQDVAFATFQLKGDYLSHIDAHIKFYSKEESDAKYQPKGDYLTEHQSLEDYYTKGESDRRYIQEHQSLDGYATEEWVENKNYLTEHQSLEEYAKLTDLNNYQPKGDYLTEHQDLSGYYTKQQINKHLLQNYYDKTDVDAMHKVITDQLTNYYTKLETESLVRLMIDNLVAKPNCYTKAESDERYASKTALVNYYYTKVEIDSMLASSGNGDKIDMSRYATVEWVNERLSNIDENIDFTNLLTKDEAENLYVRKDDVITEDDLNQFLEDNNLIDFTDYYTKEQIDEKIRNIVAGECGCEEIEALTEQEIRNLLNN